MEITNHFADSKLFVQFTTKILVADDAIHSLMRSVQQARKYSNRHNQFTIIHRSICKKASHKHYQSKNLTSYKPRVLAFSFLVYATERTLRVTRAIASFF